MREYLIINRIFSDETVKKFEAKDDAEAIAFFRRHYRMGTDDGGWNLSRAGSPLEVLASTEDEPKKPVVSYLPYA